MGSITPLPRRDGPPTARGAGAGDDARTGDGTRTAGAHRHWLRVSDGTHTAGMRWLGLSGDTWVLLAAVLAPIAVTAALVPWRGQLDAADNALFLVVVIVAVASTGRRLAAAFAALVSALSFDFFLTHPYESFRITSHSDLISELLLLVLGLAVGELAARGRRHRDRAWWTSRRVAQLHSVTELAATGADTRMVVDAAAHALGELLTLRSCRFERGDLAGTAARVTPDGEVVVGTEHWSTEGLGLPTRGVDLPVRSAGWLRGHFLLTPAPGVPVTGEQLRIAVAIADQVGAALAAEDPSPTDGGPVPPSPVPGTGTGTGTGTG